MCSPVRCSASLKWLGDSAVPIRDDGDGPGIDGEGGQLRGLGDGTINPGF